MVKRIKDDQPKARTRRAAKAPKGAAKKTAKKRAGPKRAAKRTAKRSAGTPARSDAPPPSEAPMPSGAAALCAAGLDAELLEHTDPVDRDLAGAAVRKRQAGETPTRVEVAALARVSRSQEETRRWKHYRSIPQKHWREMSGRQTKVLQEQAELHGLPFADATVDLPKVVRALHDFLAENKVKLQRAAEPTTQEKIRELELENKRFELARQRREWIRRADVHEGFEELAGVLRRAGEALQRQFGEDAHAVLDEALQSAEAVLTKRFA